MPLGLSGSCQDKAMLFFAVFSLFTTVMGDGAEQKKKIRALFALTSRSKWKNTLDAMERCDAIFSNCTGNNTIVWILGFNLYTFKSLLVITYINIYAMSAKSINTNSIFVIDNDVKHSCLDCFVYFNRK